MGAARESVTTRDAAGLRASSAQAELGQLGKLGRELAPSSGGAVTGPSSHRYRAATAHFGGPKTGFPTTESGTTRAGRRRLLKGNASFS